MSIHLLNQNNVMLDLETMSKGSNAAIIAIGAVKFNQTVTSRFYAVVNLQSSIDIGLEMDADTVLWWLKQSDESRADLALPGVSICDALADFATWIGNDAVMWGNGAMFDNVIMTNAYRLAGFGDPPWSFWNDMCYRTVKNMNKHIKIQRVGIHHNAVHDAESQALHLINILNA